ncbi:MAG: hypothetical protein ACK5YW_15860 [Betaproteobacteria bacterium]|jgi:hypothetical protein|nr:hypothetical protein [Rhodocyclaceae bacterium]MCA3133588.1 hypothetical protein [Rhodocyclaceae bacterium]MCA3141517.1 hypothetical protein [Rhodocyclaceae bacterium]MCA3145853.1 hypothetical protein [Rhodocyclaceae bacterium]MCE2897106.1 hypothetical protein [Betaproteobacteria bacterium]
MSRAPHLVVDISPHGFGHAAMTMPVLSALVQCHPGLRLTVRAGAPHAWLRPQLPVGTSLLPTAPDLGMAMHHALGVDVPASMRWYRALFAEWDRHLGDAAAALVALEADAVLSNVGFLPLAAAAHAGIPAAAFCCLNWADVLAHYASAEADCGALVAWLRALYGAADVFLAPAPSMPMDWLPNRVAVPPVARLGRDCRQALRRRLGASEDDRVVLLSLGGVAFPVDVSLWPALPGVKVVAGMPVMGAHPQVYPAADLQMSWIDLLASSDAVLTKPGYGTVTEAACNGIPVLYLPRQDWPEEPHLLAWLRQHGRCGEVPREALAQGRFHTFLPGLLSQPSPLRPRPNGVRQTAVHLADWLRGRRPLPAGNSGVMPQ